MSDQENLAALGKVTSFLGNTEKKGIDALARLDPSRADEIQEKLHAAITAEGLRTAGAPEWADDRQRGAKGSAADELMAIVKRENERPEHRAQMIAAVANAAGMNQEEAAALVADLNTAARAGRVEHDNKGGLLGIGGHRDDRKNAEHIQDELYGKIHDQLAASLDRSAHAAAERLKADPLVLELAMHTEKNPGHVSRDQAQRLLASTDGMDFRKSDKDPMEAGDVVRLIGANSPGHIEEISKKADAYNLARSTGDEAMAARAGEALAKELTSAVADYSRAHGGKDQPMTDALAAFTGGDKAETARLVHTIAATSLEEERLSKGRDSGHGPHDTPTGRNSARVQELEALRHASEESISGSLLASITGPRRDAVLAAAVVATSEALAATQAAATPPQPPAEQQTAATGDHPDTHHHAGGVRRNGQPKVTEIAVEGGGTIDAKTFQRAVIQAGGNINYEGSRTPDGVDGDIGDRTMGQFLAKIRDNGAHKGDTSTHLYADEVAQIQQLAATYKAPTNTRVAGTGEHHDHDTATPAQPPATAPARVAARATEPGQEVTSDEHGGLNIKRSLGRNRYTEDELHAAPGAANLYITESGVMGTVTTGEGGKKEFHRLSKEEQQEHTNRNLLAAVTGDPKALNGGADTEQLIKKFQQDWHPDSRTGKFDEHTISALKTQVNNNAGLFNFTNVEVLAAEGAAKVAGSATSPFFGQKEKEMFAAATGDRDVLTADSISAREAVRQFQQSHHLGESGVVDTKTMSAVVAQIDANYKKLHDGQGASREQEVADLIKPLPTPEQRVAGGPQSRSHSG